MPDSEEWTNSIDQGRLIPVSDCVYISVPPILVSVLELAPILRYRYRFVIKSIVLASMSIMSQLLFMNTIIITWLKWLLFLLHSSLHLPS